MTDIEKIKRHDALQSLRQRIGGCFGASNGIFAGHSLDENKAKELRKLASEKSILLIEILEITLGYLYGKEYNGDHINTQIKNVEFFFGKKIN
jgi:hypothetical protein